MALVLRDEPWKGNKQKILGSTLNFTDPGADQSKQERPQNPYQNQQYVQAYQNFGNINNSNNNNNNVNKYEPPQYQAIGSSSLSDFPGSFALPKIPNFISSIAELQADPPQPVPQLPQFPNFDFSSDVEIQKTFDLGVNSSDRPRYFQNQAKNNQNQNLNINQNVNVKPFSNQNPIQNSPYNGALAQIRSDLVDSTIAFQQKLQQQNQSRQNPIQSIKPVPNPQIVRNIPVTNVQSISNPPPLQVQQQMQKLNPVQPMPPLPQMPPIKF